MDVAVKWVVISKPNGPRARYNTLGDAKYASVEFRRLGWSNVDIVWINASGEEFVYVPPTGEGVFSVPNP